MAKALTRWDPLADIADLRGRFDLLFDELGGPSQGAWTPAIDLVRHDDGLILRVDLPGLKSEEVQIELEDGVLTVSGEHEERHSEEDDGGRHVRRERRFGAFSRCSAEEVCDALDISPGNQRVLLHRARSRVRTALEEHLQ